MGLLQLLLDLFNVKDNNREVVLLSNMEDWLLRQSNDLDKNGEMNPELNIFVNKIKDKRWFLDCKLDEWEIKLAGEEDKDDIKQIFLQTRGFLENLEFSEDLSLGKLLLFHKKLGRELDQLFKAIQQSNFSHDFSFLLTDKEKEIQQQGALVNPLYQELLDLNSIWERFEQKIIKSGLQKMDTIARRANQLIESSKVISKLNEGLNDKKEKLDFLKSKMVQKEEELHKIKNRPELKNLIIENNQRKDLSGKLESYKEKISSFFSELNPILFQYSKIQPDNDIVKNYLDNPLPTFINDDGLQILHIINHIKALEKAGKIIFENNSPLNQENLENLHKNYLSARKEADVLYMSKLTDHLLIKMEDAQYRLEHFSQQVNKLKNEVTLVKEKISEHKSTLNQRMIGFQNLVKVTMGKNIKIE
jgi:hypothetical protein